MSDGSADATDKPPGWPVLALVAYLVAFTAFALWLQLGTGDLLAAIDQSPELHGWHVVMVVASVEVLGGWLPVFIGLSALLGALFIERKRRVRIGQICAALFALVIVIGFVQVVVLAMAAASVPPAFEGTPVPDLEPAHQRAP